MVLQLFKVSVETKKNERIIRGRGGGGRKRPTVKETKGEGGEGECYKRGLKGNLYRRKQKSKGGHLIVQKHINKTREVV